MTYLLPAALKNELAQKIITQAPLGDNPDWKFEMGELLMLTNRPVQAQQYFDDAIVQLANLKLTSAPVSMEKALTKKSNFKQNSDNSLIVFNNQF